MSNFGTGLVVGVVLTAVVSPAAAWLTQFAMDFSKGEQAELEAANYEIVQVAPKEAAEQLPKALLEFYHRGVLAHDSAQPSEAWAALRVFVEKASRFGGSREVQDARSRLSRLGAQKSAWGLPSSLRLSIDLLARQQRRWEEALVLLNELQEQGPLDFEHKLLRVHVLGQLDRTAIAVREAEELVTTHADQPRAWEAHGLAWFRHGEELDKGSPALSDTEKKPGAEAFEKAVRSLQKFVAMDPTNGMGWRTLGMALRFLGKTQEAEEALARVAVPQTPSIVAPQPSAGVPATAKEWRDRGVAKALVGAMEEALSCFEEALQKDPEYADAWDSKAVALGRMQRTEEALVAMERALSLGGKNGAFKKHEGALLAQKQQFPQALESFRIALEWDSSLKETLLLSADIEERQGNLSSAKTLLERFLAEAPDTQLKVLPEARQRLERVRAVLFRQTTDGLLQAMDLDDQGVAFFEKGNVEKALVTITQATIVDAAYPIAWFHKGNILRALGRVAESTEAYKKAVELRSDFSQAWSNLGISLGMQNRAKEALEALDQAVALDPQNAGTLANRANALCELDRFEEAIQAAEQALQVDPHLAAALGNKGRALGGLGRLVEAGDCFQRAVRYDPRDVMAWTNLALTLGKLGKLKEGLALVERALELEPSHGLALQVREALQNDLRKKAAT